MKKLLVVFLLLCCGAVAQNTPPAAASSAAPPSVATSADKARKLLDQMVVALGGDAWLNYKTLSTIGRTYSFFHGKPTTAGVRYWSFYEYPDKLRREFTKQRDVVYIYNGDKGYEITYKGTSADDPKTVAEVIRRRKHSLEVAIRQWLKQPGTQLFFDGRAIADQKMVDVVSILNKDDEQLTIGMDIDTRLPVNTRYTWRDQDKYKVEDEVIYGNYRKVQGIMTPYTLTSQRDGEIDGQRFLNDAVYDKVYAPGFFDATITYDREHYNSKAKKK